MADTGVCFLTKITCANGSVWAFHCSDSKSACPVEGLVVCDGSAIINIPNYEVQSMVIVRGELMIDKILWYEIMNVCKLDL